MEFPRRIGRWTLTGHVARVVGGGVYSATDDAGKAARVHHLQAWEEPDLADLALFGEELERVRRLPPEARALPILDWGVHEDVPYVVHEDPGGAPLDHAALGNMPVARARALAVELALAVEIVHRRGFVHQRLQPQTIALDRAGRPFLCGFGEWALVRTMRTRSGPPPSAEVLAYMSPEAVRLKPVGPAGDAWALAMIVWRLLVGPLPNWAGDDAPYLQILERTISGHFELPSDHGLPALLARELLRQLEPDPAARGEDGSWLLRIALETWDSR